MLIHVSIPMDDFRVATFLVSCQNENPVYPCVTIQLPSWSTEWLGVYFVEFSRHIEEKQKMFVFQVPLVLVSTRLFNRDPYHGVFE